MLGTLCFCENWLGPYHPQTLRLMVEAGIACSGNGDQERARCLLTRASRDLSRALGPSHELRTRAIAGLRDLFVQMAEWERAAEVQRDLVQCQTLRFGPDHLQTHFARTDLGNLLLKAPLARVQKGKCIKI